jgi:hypothetical protein
LRCYTAEKVFNKLNSVKASTVKAGGGREGGNGRDDKKEIDVTLNLSPLPTI